MSFYQPFTHGFLQVDIHELLAPDLLHQLIKGVFKDHLITWVADYLHITHGETAALEIIEDIDHRYVYLHHDSHITLTSSKVSQLFLHSLGFGGSLMVGITISGQVMTRKH
jgi:Plavaka transposase